ncbi:MAG: YgiQ family radical SAM protein [Candidatus Alcyoniella australis]|nr:YgiQ family radical SAM protein [Candidatus Alcyoniella australis]
MTHLPIDLNQARERGWDALDVVLVTGDGNVDHPAFPAALLGRWLEHHGYRVGLISRPDARDPESIATLGLPRLFFGVTSGALDSMVANYTALKRRRSDDPFAPGGKAGGRPDRALIAYCNLIRQRFGKSTLIVAGGIEAGLRRFAHYDFWSEKVRRPLLMDCGADVLVHGMGEGPLLQIARNLEQGPSDRESRIDSLRTIPGVVHRTPRSAPPPSDGLELPSSEQVAADPRTQAQAHQLATSNAGRVLWQDCGGMRVIHNPAWPTATSAELDTIYSLPFTRDPHPSLHGLTVPALEQVRFSITSHRGCFGGCAFCAINAIQGHRVSSRSRESILSEVERIVRHPQFRGTINDLGGPTANFYAMGCTRDKPCDRRSCLWPEPCGKLRASNNDYIKLLRAARKVPGVKHLFVTTGLRTDPAVLGPELIRELAAHHTSGLIKVAPEHVSPCVLELMHKPPIAGFERFLEMFRSFSREAGKKQYVIPYIMAAHPGSSIDQMIEVYHFLKRHNLRVEQCQIFTPTPGTDSTVMYATGLNPATLEPVFVERDPKRKNRQKALILYHLPESRRLLGEILKGAKPKQPESKKPTRRR